MDSKELAMGIVAAVLVATVVLSPVACTAHRHKVIAELIEGGTSPLEAKCAIEGDSLGTNTCAALAATRIRE